MRKILKKNLGLTLVVGLIVVLGGLGLTLQRVDATVTVPSGNDTFTTPDNAQSYDDFSTHPIPAGFFGEGSLAFTGRMVVKGGPPVDPNLYGTADTVIKRVSAVTVPGDTSLAVVGLSMVSAAPITVNYAKGGSEQWNVTVNQSSVASSGGTMHFNADGTFNSRLTIYPKYTFTRSGSSPRVLDTGSGGGSAPINLSSNNGTWSQSGSVTVINPGREQDILASHGVTPAPPPCPSPTRITPIDDTTTRTSSPSASKAITPCVTEAETTTLAEP